jgi:hypothetical protein
MKHNVHLIPNKNTPLNNRNKHDALMNIFKAIKWPNALNKVCW